MAHHYPAHAQNQAYQSYPAPAAYGYSAPAYYPGYQPRPGGGYAFDGAVGATSAQPQVGPHSAPELPGVTPQLASHVMERLVSSELRDAGFESAEAGALRRLEREVAECELFALWLNAARMFNSHRQSCRSYMNARTTMPTLHTERIR